MHLRLMNVPLRDHTTSTHRDTSQLWTNFLHWKVGIINEKYDRLQVETHSHDQTCFHQIQTACCGAVHRNSLTVVISWIASRSRDEPSRVTSDTIADSASLTAQIAEIKLQNESKWHSSTDNGTLIYRSRGWCCAVTVSLQSTGCDEEHDKMQKHDAKSDGSEHGAPPTS